jgi:ethanolamine ammonia-lyase small subunit
MTDDPAANEILWGRLRQHTAARIGLKRSGASLATGPLLEFNLAHARARDAVQAPFDEARLAADVAGLGLPVLTVASAIADKQQYLMRPDLGRRLAASAEAELAAHIGSYDLVFVVSDGLSAGAVHTHAQPVLAGVLQVLRAQGWRIAPLVIVRYGRVAVGDAVAGALHADCVAVLIGERPGLSSPYSMGVYLTWKPSALTSDVDRNCISNVSLGGIGYADAVYKLTHLLGAMRARRLSGVLLKDDSDRVLIGR